MGNFIGRSQKATAVFFSEAYSRFLAIRILCEDGMANTASIVLRSLLDLFFMMHWILRKHREARAKRYIGWFWREMMKRIRKNPSDYELDQKKLVRDNYKVVRHLYARRVKDSRTGRTVNRRSKWWYWPHTIKKMADDIGLTHHYEHGYKPLSWTVHVDPNYVVRKALGSKIAPDPCYDEEMLSEVLVGNFSYFRQICETVDQVFELDMKDTLKLSAAEQKRFPRGFTP